MKLLLATLILTQTVLFSAAQEHGNLMTRELRKKKKKNSGSKGKGKSALPEKDVIDYATFRSFILNGGCVDLDSNTACDSIDGIVAGVFYQSKGTVFQNLCCDGTKFDFAQLIQTSCPQTVAFPGNCAGMNGLFFELGTTIYCCPDIGMA